MCLALIVTVRWKREDLCKLTFNWYCDFSTAFDLDRFKSSVRLYTCSSSTLLSSPCLYSDSSSSCWKVPYYRAGCSAAPHSDVWTDSHTLPPSLPPSLPASLPHSLTLHPSDTHIHTHSSNYGNQQADPISVSCLLSPGGWLPDHLTLHNLIWQGVTPRLLTPPAACVCVCAYSSMCKCVGPH